MPTVGWILEGDIERFFSATERITDPRPLSFQCPFCSATFPVISEQKLHISVDHPLERPVLLIRGAAAPTEIIVRTPLARADIGLVNTTSARLQINGGLVRDGAPEDVAAALTTSLRALLKIKLRNDRSTDGARTDAAHEIRIAIPTPESLDTVDATFRRLLARDDVDFAAMSEFHRACSGREDAVEYAGALADYVAGILIKDSRGGATLPPARCNEKFQGALAVLKDFRKPLARVVVDCIRLNLNDFCTPHSPCKIPYLDDAMELFSRIARGLEPLPRSLATSAGAFERACPIDRDSEVILGACAGALSGNADDGTAQLSRLNARGTTSADRAKIEVLLALKRLASGASSAAEPWLRSLTNDPIFGVWARTHLPRSAR